MKLLHLYAQPSWHIDAYIVGNRAGLEALRDAINRAFSGPGERNADATPHGDGFVCANDGEGYQVIVLREDGPNGPGSRWLDLAAPYTDVEAGAVEHRELAFHPSEFVSTKKYQELTGVREVSQ